MRSYQVPPDTSAKEKVVGGLLTWGQLAWVAGGLILSAIVFSTTFKVFGKGALFFAILFLPAGTTFAFYKKHELTLFDYIIRKRKFKKKLKELPNLRKEVDD